MRLLVTLIDAFYTDKWNSFAEEYRSDAIYPAHLFKAVLYKKGALHRQCPSLCYQSKS